MDEDHLLTKYTQLITFIYLFIYLFIHLFIYLLHDFYSAFSAHNDPLKAALHF